MTFIIIFIVCSILYFILRKILGERFANFLLYGITSLVWSVISFVLIGMLGFIHEGNAYINIFFGIWAILFVVVALIGTIMKD